MTEILNKLFGALRECIHGVINLYSGLDPCFVGGSIADSFAVLVGFVAIGIPLSLQVISRATQKYKSDHLIRYLSSWGVVTPKRIYWVSIFYFIFALVFKSLLPVNAVDCKSADLVPYAWGLIVLFLALVVVVGLWYGHLFSQAEKSPKEIYDALKK